MDSTIAAPAPPVAPVPFWRHPGYAVSSDGLWLDGHSLPALARAHGTPLYVYSQAAIIRQLEALQSALRQAVGAHKIYYAMKANRHPAVLAAVRRFGAAGVDTCSPREVRLALAHGFAASELSCNGSMHSDRDLRELVACGVHCTFDTYSALRRYAALAPRGARVGLRFNPGVHVGYRGNPRLNYSHGKFGFDLDDADGVLAAAERLGLLVDRVHMHLGWGLPESSLVGVRAAFERLAAIAARVPALADVNVGGGLGGRYIHSDQPLSLASWAGALADIIGPLRVPITCEPGTFVAAPAGVLIVEVNTVERRRGRTWVGVDAGFAVNPNPAGYGIPLTVIALDRPDADPGEVCTIAGNINEAGDLWAEDVALPPVAEGDLLAFVPAGAYGASMASDHCLRGQPRELGLPIADEAAEFTAPRSP